jgi:uncharacterized protein (TIGR03435 family)
MRSAAIAWLLAATVVAAQTPRPTFDAFEVATIKPTPPDWRGGRFAVMQSTDQFAARSFTLRHLVAAAYQLNPRAIAGGPAWIETDPYDILAKTPGGIRPTVDEQMAMLRQLLTDRFQLSFHREEKELAYYALVVAKGGPKMKSAAVPDGAPSLVNRIYPDRVALPARNATMPLLAAMMQRSILDRPVLDRTGLTGAFDFDLEWTPDESQFEGRIRAPAEPTKPALFTAMQEQLGLRLEPARGPVAVLVIDRVERPSEN